VLTLGFTPEDWHPRQVAEKMAAQNINLWDGNDYAIRVTHGGWGEVSHLPNHHAF